MELKELLEQEGMINKTALAKEMYPGIKTARVRLMQKLAETEGKTGKQRVTEADEVKAKDVLGNFANRLLKYVSS